MNSRDFEFTLPRWWPHGTDPAAITDRNVIDGLAAFSKRLASFGDILLSAEDNDGFADGTMRSLAELLREHADQLNDFGAALYRQRFAEGGAA